MTPTAAEIVTRGIGALGLQLDQQVVILAGYLCRTRPSINPDKFTDAMASLWSAGGLPADDCLDFLCYLIDKDNQPEAFAAFLTEVAAAFAPAPFQLAPPPAAAATTPVELPVVKVPVFVNQLIFQRVEALLTEPRPLRDMDLGHVIHRFTAKVQNQGQVKLHEIVVDVVNADSGPQLDPYLMHHSTCVMSGPPTRDLVKPIVIVYSGVQFEVQLVASEQGQI